MGQDWPAHMGQFPPTFLGHFLGTRVTGPASPTLPLALRRGAGVSLAVQLASQVRELVHRSVLRPGDRLPSTRALAVDLAVARAVVEQAYDQLLAEGWLVARRGAGTFVSDVGPVPVMADVRAHPPLEQPREPNEPILMDTGTPWVDPRHDDGWRRAWRSVSVARMPRGYPDPAGIPELRAELATYLGRTRGVHCHPDDVVVTAGTTHGLAMLLDVLPPGPVAVEDPGYRAAVSTVQQAGREVVDVPLDAEGIDVSWLRGADPDLQAIYVTPAHQHPMGTTMSAGRRIAVLAEAARRHALVVEDDYDSEFRYDVAPVPALAALDRERVVSLGTASKSVHPALRVGWLVAPTELVGCLVERRASRHDHPSWPLQWALLAMLRDGHVDRLVRSARRRYAQRSRAVVAALSPYAEIGPPPAGMYLTLALPGPVADAVRHSCRRAGFEVPSLASYSRSAGLTGLVIGFGGVTDDELARALEVMGRALRSASASNARGPFSPT